MARIFITGSADGIGLLAAKKLVEDGHQVVLHARNEQKAQACLEKIPGAENVVIADLTSIEETKQLASKVNALGSFDAIIHNAGVYHASGSEIFAVNTLAPYILTCLIEKPQRLIYLSSDLHLQGKFKPADFGDDYSPITYSDSKLHVLMLCKAVARKWPNIYANALHPGWVPTKMGGSNAPDDLDEGFATQVWLAASNDEKAKVNGRYFYHQNETRYNPEADNIDFQERFLKACESLTGIAFPEK